jgi:hypothetical protein
MKKDLINRTESYLKEEDSKILQEIIKEIKELSGVLCIIQIGSSTYSKDYHDIDLIIFFNQLLPPPEIHLLNKKYQEYNFSIEGVSTRSYQIDRGVKIFIKFLDNLKTKKILYGEYPYKKIKVSLNKIDVAYYIRYQYNFASSQHNYGNLLSTSLNALLTYKNIFPENKEETLSLFIKNFPRLAKFFPENINYFLRNTDESNIAQLYPFFEASIKFLLN